MKEKIFIVLFLMVLSAFFIATSAKATPSVSFNVLDTDIEAGETFDVEVLLDGDDLGAELLSFGFDVIMPATSFFSYNDYAIGLEFFDDNPTRTPNTYVAGCTIFPDAMVDDYLLATLSFNALSAGTDTLGVQGIVDGWYGLYYYDPITDTDYDFDIDGTTSITINPVGAPVPEPSTIFLLAVGFVGIIGIKTHIYHLILPKQA